MSADPSVSTAARCTASSHEARVTQQVPRSAELIGHLDDIHLGEQSLELPDRAAKVALGQSSHPLSLSEGSAGFG